MTIDAALPGSRLAYGCAHLAGWIRAVPSAETRVAASALLHSAFEQGITLFDTADIYGFGWSEAVIGGALRSSPALRRGARVQTKCGQILGVDWRPGMPIGVDLRAAHIVEAARGSLRRLGVETIDTLLLHAFDALAPMPEIGAAIETLHRSGDVRHFGVSNFTGTQLSRLQRHCDRKLVVNQLQLGLGHPHLLLDGLDLSLELASGASRFAAYQACAGSGTIEQCRDLGVEIQAWSPLRRAPLAPGATDAAESPLGRRLEAIARAAGVSRSAVALAWLLRHPAGIVPIVGTTDLTHLAMNMEALDLVLSRADWYALAALAANLPKREITPAPCHIVDF